MQSLEELESTTASKQRFNQFEGKKSDYQESLYTSKLDESKITQS